MSIKITKDIYKRKNPVIIIGGTTASGKSALSLDVAKNFNGVIINADSMQIYKDLPIISACPSVDDMKQAPHKLYQILSHNQDCSAGKWCELATNEIIMAWNSGNIPIIVGGTGMYIKSLIDGLSPIPDIDDKIKHEVRELSKTHSAPELHQILNEFDNKTALKLSENDTQRISRAIEVYKGTGISLSDWHQQPNRKILPQANFFTITILPTKEELYPACDTRFAKMIKEGAIDEVKNALDKGASENSAMFNSLGAKQIASYLREELSIEEAEELSCRQTRQYAKRQNTWFKNQISSDICINERYNPDNLSSIKEEIEVFLNSDN